MVSDLFAKSTTVSLPTMREGETMSGTFCETCFGWIPAPPPEGLEQMCECGKRESEGVVVNPHDPDKRELYTCKKCNELHWFGEPRSCEGVVVEITAGDLAIGTRTIELVGKGTMPVGGTYRLTRIDEGE